LRAFDAELVLCVGESRHCSVHLILRRRCWKGLGTFGREGLEEVVDQAVPGLRGRWGRRGRRGNFGGLVCSVG
jgi:hypothetical protein